MGTFRILNDVTFMQSDIYQHKSVKRKNIVKLDLLLFD